MNLWSVSNVNSTMKQLWRALEILAWTAFFAFAVLVLALRFWLLPNIERYRDDIVAAVTQTVGRPVKIGAIEAGWLGLHPQVSFADVRIYDAEGREALVLPSVDNVVSWKSLVRGRLRLESLAIDGPRLSARRDAAGALYVAGIKLSGAKGDGAMLDWMLRQDEIVVRNAAIEWQDEMRGAPPLALSALDLRLRNSGNTHSLGISARPPPALGSGLELRAELTGGSAADPAAWSGRLYAELGYTDLAGWQPWVDYPVEVQAGQGALRLWASLQKGRVVQATADVELAGVAARLEKDLPLLELAKMSGRIQALRRDQGFDLAGKKLVVAALRGPAMGPADIRLEWRPEGKAAEQGTLSATLVELEPLAQLVEALPFPEELRKHLAELAPRGRLLDAQLEWSGKLAQPAKFGAKAKFSELAMNARDSFPGVAGLSGSIEATEAKGRVQLASRKAELELPRALSERILLDMLEGQIDWERKGERALDVKLASLSFGNEDLEGKAAGSYSNSGEGPGAIDLEANLKRVDASRVARYLQAPAILGQATRGWLSAAIVEGRGSDVRLKVKGDLRDFPFLDPGKGQFQVAARVEKGVLEYVRGWPRITDIDAELLFERDRMEIVARSASVLGAKLANVRVNIPSLLAPPVHLLVEGQADGPTSEFLKFIESSPVHRMIGDCTAGMIAAGRGKLALKLDLPLRDLASTKVEGAFDFAANTVIIPHGNLPPVEQAGGKISFTQSSLALQGLKGRVFGGPISVSGGTRPGGALEIVARGDAQVAALQPLFDHPWARYLSGAAPYSATLQAQEGRARIIVESSLRGVSSALPAPLAKSPAEPLPLRIEIRSADASGRERISATLGALAAVEVQRRRNGDAMALQRAAVLLMPSGRRARLPERPGVLVYGSLDAFDADRWLAFFAGGQHADIADVALDLKIGTLDAYGKRIHALALRADVAGAGWSAVVQSEEIAGDVSFRGEGGGKLVARLTQLRVPGDYPGAKPQDANRTREWPSVDFIAERFVYKDKELGRVELAAQREGADWRIDKIALSNAEASVSGKGIWRTGEAPQASVSLDLDTSDAGKALERAGYPGLVRGGKARMQAALTWTGELHAIDYPSLSGSLQLQAEDGQFLEIEPGLGKLISLMSLQALPKRLALDFRDVFSKGFQFDRIAAAGDIGRGVMTLKDFNMRGSAAEVDMEGEVDLAKETQNLRVRVIPSLGDSASAVLAFVNPFLFFPVAIAQRILKDPLGHIFAFNYTITGSWADPKVEKRAVEARAVEHPATPAN
jgi:uncharacterized protein (TIGR02099 family)